MTETPQPFEAHFTALLRKQAHDSGDGVTVYHCLAGETRFLTLDGMRTLADAAGQEVLVLTSGLGEERGRWVPAHVHAFGAQRLYRVSLRRNKQTKVLYATDGHRWLVRRPDRVLTTLDLRPGQRLAHVRAERYTGVMDHEGVRHGFHFGDGTVHFRPNDRTYGAVTLWGAKQDLDHFFEEVAGVGHPVQTLAGVLGTRFTAGLKGYTKELPSLSAPAEYLYGWLAGYIAADGSVGRTGQVSLTSTVLENLEHVRDLATVLGIGTFGITSKQRVGYGSEPSTLFTLGFSAADLPRDFFLREDHLARCNPNATERFGWTVVGVESTDRTEEVYCAVVPDTQSFALEDNIHSGNCPFCGSGQVLARSDRTIECEFCHTAFTVQVQPVYPAFPQTVNGMPVQVPGMPGEIGNPAPAVDPMGDPTQVAGAPAPLDQPADASDDEADSEDEQEDDDESGDGPPFDKASSLRTSAGAWLGKDAYLAHLATRFTDDRATTVAAIRARQEARRG